MRTCRDGWVKKGWRECRVVTVSVFGLLLHHSLVVDLSLFIAFCLSRMK